MRVSTSLSLSFIYGEAGDESGVPPFFGLPFDLTGGDEGALGGLRASITASSSAAAGLSDMPRTRESRENACAASSHKFGSFERKFICGLGVG